MKKLQLTRFLMTVTILFLAAFESYWLQKLYQDEYKSLITNVNVTFRDVMDQLQRSRFEKDTTLLDSTFTQPYPKKNTLVYNARIPLKKGSLHKINPGEIRSITLSSDSNQPSIPGVPPPKLFEIILKSKAGLSDSIRRNVGINAQALGDTLVQKISLSSSAPVILKKNDKNREGTTKSTSPKVFIEMRGKGNESPIIRFLATNKTINDSIPVRVIDSAYRAGLSAIKKELPFAIEFKKYAQHPLPTVLVTCDSLHDVITAPFFVGYNTPFSYQAKFGDISLFVIKDMQLQIWGSLLLLLLVAGSFVVLYRNLRAQQQLTLIKNDFISNITHELKTPLATVNVAIEALRKFGGLQNPERTREYLDISASELQRLGLLVDKVLRLSMFEKQEITLQKQSIDVKALVQEVLASMKLQFEKQNAQLSFDFSGTDFLVEGDYLHLSSVVYNLLDNALKYSKDQPVVSVYLKQRETSLELRVTDAGIGISENYQRKIFDQFFRVPQGNRHNSKGYGLGLSYVHHIIKNHQGTIAVTSELGSGSTFTVTLPSKKTDPHGH